MSKRIYISADYDKDSGDREVVEELNTWGQDDLHKVDFVDMSKVVSGSVSNDSNCRICDLKAEFNCQINASSAVVFIVGNKTKDRTAGCTCERASKKQIECTCTPYKGNCNGSKPCKVYDIKEVGENDDYGNINSCSYLKHEFMQAKKKGKNIIILYNSTRKEHEWLPYYMLEYESIAEPFWHNKEGKEKVGNYSLIKKALGYD